MAARPSSTPVTEGAPEASAAAGALPNVVIVGAQKCGTTALHYYLRRHPDIEMSKPKELNFFIDEREPVKGERPPPANWKRGIDWYRGHFDADTKLRGESSPDYTAHPHYPGIPERMGSVVPDAKLIFMVRDPIERIRAQWIHNYANRVQHEPLERAVLDPGSTYLTRSSYALQLERFLEHYPSPQILVLDQLDMLERRRDTIAETFRFLDVDDSFWVSRYETLTYETKNRRRRTPLGSLAAKLPLSVWKRVRNRAPFSFPFERPEMSDRLRAEPSDRLRDDADRLRQLTGKGFEGWSV
jgi:Sulfotransferase domain